MHPLQLCRYFDGPLFDAEAELLYSRSVGGYSNNVKDLKVRCTSIGATALLPLIRPERGNPSVANVPT